MRCVCECIWGTPDPGPVRLKDVQQQVVLDANRTGTSVCVCVCVCVCVSEWAHVILPSSRGGLCDSKVR